MVMFDEQGLPHGKSIQIKPFSEDTFLNNEETLIALLKENMDINFPEIPIDINYVIETYNKMFGYHKDGSAILIGAFLGSRLVGFIWAYKKDFFTKRTLHVREIVVHSKARSCGIGEKLLLEIENIAIEEGIDSLDLMCSIHNKKAAKFYVRIGFIPKRYHFEKRLIRKE